MSFGTKSVTTTFVFLSAILFFYQSDLSRSENLLQVDATSALFIGIVSSLFGIFVYQWTDPRSPSRYNIEVRRNLSHSLAIILAQFKSIFITVDKNDDGMSLEWPRFLLFLQIFSSLLLFSLVLFSQRELALLEKIPQQLNWGSTRFCEDPKDRLKDAEQRPECQLLIRAHQLGYADDLGDCGVIDSGEPKWCDLRRKDEPYLHYAYRRLRKSADNLQNFLDKIDSKHIEKQYEQEKNRFTPLALSRMSELAQNPRSRHFIIMNLPEPSGWAWKSRLNSLIPSRCISENDKFPNRLPEVRSKTDLSNNIVMSLGHLLFDSKYSKVIGSCKEYTYIWNQSDTICQDLRKDTEATLKQLRIKNEITEVIERQRNNQSAYADRKILQPKDVISLNCLQYGKLNERQKVYAIEVDGVSLWLKILNYPELEYSVGDSVQSLLISSKLASIRFHYGRLVSKSNFSAEDRLSVEIDLVNQTDFPLTRLVFLEDLDVYLGSSWINERQDYLEVYPYYLHLGNLVDTFRTDYEQGRGRL